MGEICDNSTSLNGSEKIILDIDGRHQTSVENDGNGSEKITTEGTGAGAGAGGIAETTAQKTSSSSRARGCYTNSSLVLQVVSEYCAKLENVAESTLEKRDVTGPIYTKFKNLMTSNFVS